MKMGIPSQATSQPNKLPKPGEAVRHSARRCWHCCCLGVLLLAAGGCVEPGVAAGDFDLVWGQQGQSAGRLQKPRAMAIDRQDHVYIVDMTARIQVFTTDGQLLRHWQTPASELGKPSGLSIGRDGNLLVADTHYARVLVYSPEGELLQTVGGVSGSRPGEFGFVTDAVQDVEGNFYVSEYGDYDRVQKISPDGQFISQWGGHGAEPGQFRRPQNLAVDAQGNIWVADACNHRIQAFDTDGNLLKVWGTEGSGPGQLRYPYDLEFDDQGRLWVIEFGNHRVQVFSPDGQSLGCYGTHGRRRGQFHNPWALALDSNDTVYVLDTYNHRVQRLDE